MRALVIACAASLVFAGAPARATSPGLTGRLVFVQLTGRMTITESRIVTVNADGGDGLAVTKGNLDRDAQWSPDGQRIAFTRTHPSDQDNQEPPVTDIMVVNADGTDARTVISGPGYAEPAWARDGGTLVFVGNSGGGQDLYWVRLDGSGLHRLTYTKKDERQPKFSPDGRSIAYSKQTAEFAVDLYIMDADGTHQRLLVRDAGSETWSPDGRMIAYVNDQLCSGHYCGDVWAVRPDGTDVHRLFIPVNRFNSKDTSRVDAGTISWSPNGCRFALSFAPKGAADEANLAVTSLTGSGFHAITKDYESVSPDWQPIPHAGAPACVQPEKKGRVVRPIAPASSPTPTHSPSPSPTPTFADHQPVSARTPTKNSGGVALVVIALAVLVIAAVMFRRRRGRLRDEVAP